MDAVQRDGRRTSGPASPLRDSGLDRELKAWLAGIGRGDEGALRAFFERTSRFVRGTAYGILRNSAHADDVMQEVYLTVWHRAASFDPTQGRALAWLALITRNKAIDLLRSHRAQRTVALDDALPEPGSAGEATFATTKPSTPQVDDVAIRIALGRLRPEYREALVLAFFHGHCHTEIAERMGVPLGTAKSWVRRGLVAIKGALDEGSAGD